MKLPRIDALSGSDSDLSDDEANANSMRLKANLLSASKSRKEPDEYFELFFNDDLLATMVEQTNIYIYICVPKKTKILNVMKEEMKVFLTGLCLSSIFPLPNKRPYGSSSDLLPKILGDSMRRDRFLDILHYLHMVDSTKSTSNDRAYKIRPLLDSLQDSFKFHGGLDGHLSVDESMIPYSESISQNNLLDVNLSDSVSKYGVCA